MTEARSQVLPLTLLVGELSSNVAAGVTAHNWHRGLIMMDYC